MNAQEQENTCYIKDWECEIREESSNWRGNSRGRQGPGDDLMHMSSQVFLTSTPMKPGDFHVFNVG